MSTRPAADVARDIADAFEKRQTQFATDHLTRAHFIDFGDRFSIPERAIHERLERLCAPIAERVPRLQEIGLDHRPTKVLSELITRRLTDLAVRPRRHRRR